MSIVSMVLNGVPPAEIRKLRKKKPKEGRSPEAIQRAKEMLAAQSAKQHQIREERLAKILRLIKAGTCYRAMILQEFKGEACKATINYDLQELERRKLVTFFGRAVVVPTFEQVTK